MNKKAPKEKEKTKGSRRLFGRKAPKSTRQEATPKRPSSDLAATNTGSSVTGVGGHMSLHQGQQGQGQIQPHHAGVGEAFTSHAQPQPQQSFHSMVSPRNNVPSYYNNRAHRASILLTADEFDALGNYNAHDFSSPSLTRFSANPTNGTANISAPSSTIVPPIVQTRKRDLSVVASDMSSTTRRDSQKVFFTFFFFPYLKTIFWNSVRSGEVQEPLTKKELLKKQKLERKAYKMRKTRAAKKQKAREAKVRPLNSGLGS